MSEKESSKDDEIFLLNPEELIKIAIYLSKVVEEVGIIVEKVVELSRRLAE